MPADWPVHIHCFNDSAEYLKELLAAFPKAFIGITGVVTFEDAKRLKEIVATLLPLERLLVPANVLADEPVAPRLLRESRDQRDHPDQQRQQNQRPHRGEALHRERRRDQHQHHHDDDGELQAAEDTVHDPHGEHAVDRPAAQQQHPDDQRPQYECDAHALRPLRQHRPRPRIARPPLKEGGLPRPPLPFMAQTFDPCLPPLRVRPNECAPPSRRQRIHDSIRDHHVPRRARMHRLGAENLALTDRKVLLVDVVHRDMPAAVPLGHLARDPDVPRQRVEHHRPPVLPGAVDTHVERVDDQHLRAGLSDCARDDLIVLLAEKLHRDDRLHLPQH